MVIAVTELQQMPTSGARAVEAISVDGLELLAVPQLALDVPDQPAGMNAGDSGTDLLLMLRQDGRYVPFSKLPAPGGEDAEFFAIGGRSFLAVASIRDGAGPYRYTTTSRIFEWRDGGFVQFQDITTYAAKQWKHWSIGERHFLGLAQGLEVPHVEGPNRVSMIYEWDGSSFVEFQRVPSRWAYNWHPFSFDDAFFVAHADHLDPSWLYRWDGERLVPHQVLLERAGRSFAYFSRNGGHHLLVAGIDQPPTLMRWDGSRFDAVQQLAGPGARELKVVEHQGRLFVIRVNFIVGTPAAPRPALMSQVYEWRDGALTVVAEFPTCGGTDAEIVATGDDVQFVVSNSLTPSLRFASRTVLYELSADETTE